MQRFRNRHWNGGVCDFGTTLDEDKTYILGYPGFKWARLSVLKIRFVLSASFLVLLLLLACLPRAVFAQEESVGEAGDRARAVDRALGILKNVVGLNVDAYNWSVRAYGKDLFWDVLPHEFVGFDFLD